MLWGGMLLLRQHSYIFIILELFSLESVRLALFNVRFNHTNKRSQGDHTVFFPCPLHLSMLVT